MPSSEPGAELGHYRIVRLLGHGGMGDVYLARDLTLERDVAIKFLQAEGGAPDASRDRLLREAQAAAALDHPNICTVYEVGETPDGRAFIAMQYVEGETLAAILRRGPMTVRDALVLGAQITEALAAAHKRGIIHRDLKPQNVIVTSSGRPKLLDFGLAKGAVRESSSSPDAPTRIGRDGRGGRQGNAGLHVARTPPAAPDRRPKRPVRARRPAVRVPDRSARLRRDDLLADVRQDPACPSAPGILPAFRPRRAARRVVPPVARQGPCGSIPVGRRGDGRVAAPDLRLVEGRGVGSSSALRLGASAASPRPRTGLEVPRGGHGMAPPMALAGARRRCAGAGCRLRRSGGGSGTPPA